MSEEENKKISEILNIEDPVEPTEIVVSNVIDMTVKQTEKVDSDFEFINNNIKELIEKNNEAIDGILNIAKETDQPRAYEVVSTLINTAIEVNKNLLEMYKTMKEIKKDDTKSNNSNVTNNAIFVGSTKELLEVLKKNKSEKKE